MAPLRTAIQAADPTGDRTSATALALSLLSDLCEQKAAMFTEQIESDLRAAGSNENKSVPVTLILGRQTHYRASVRDTPDRIMNQVTQAVTDFLGGTDMQILNGIGRVVTTGLQGIMGAGAGSQQELQAYFVVVQGGGAIRFDVRAWARNIDTVGISEHIESCLVIVTYKSSVDVSKLDLMTFLTLYRQQLGGMDIPPADFDNYITTATETFNRLKGNGGAPGAAARGAEAALVGDAIERHAEMTGGTEEAKLPEMLPGTLYGLFKGATAPAPRDLLPRDPEAARPLPGVHG